MDTTNLTLPFFELEKKMKKALCKAGENPNPGKALRAKVEYNKCKRELEELYLRYKILGLPEELRYEIGKFIYGQRKIDNLTNRK